VPKHCNFLYVSSSTHIDKKNAFNTQNV